MTLCVYSLENLTYRNVENYYQSCTLNLRYMEYDEESIPQYYVYFNVRKHTGSLNLAKLRGGKLSVNCRVTRTVKL